MAWHDSVKVGIGWPVAIGTFVVVLGFGAFGTWAAVAPLEGAVIAPGMITTLGKNKVIQHLEGGIIKELEVAEGDYVKAGQALVLMDGTAADATRNRLQSQLDSLGATEARATAERQGLEAITFSPDLLAKASDPNVAAAIADQKSEFEARLQRHRSELGVLDQQIAALNEQISGLEAQKSAVDAQLKLATESKTDLESLLKSDLVAKSQVMDLRGKEADFIGQAGQIIAAIAQAKQQIAEKQQDEQRLTNTRLEEASKDLSDARRQRADYQEQLRTAEDTLTRVTVVAPLSGTVTNLSQVGPGSVVTPGQKLMEIVPDQTQLVVEAHIRPQDINQVHLGQPARLAFTAFDQRETPQIAGQVIYLSADRQENDRTGEAFYVARLSFSSDPVKGFDPKKIGPGQPADAFITTGERTFLAYLTDPIAKTVERSFREH